MFRKAILPAALILALFASPASASPRPTPTDLLHRAWSWLTGIWSLDALDHRGCIDPDGQPVTCGGAAAGLQARICIDPDGNTSACGSTGLQTDRGICVDPNGGCGQ